MAVNGPENQRRTLSAEGSSARFPTNASFFANAVISASMSKVARMRIGDATTDAEFTIPIPNSIGLPDNTRLVMAPHFRRNRRAFAMTETLLSDMAAPAIMGLRRMPKKG